MVREVERQPAVSLSERFHPDPHHLTRRDQPIEIRRQVAVHAGRQNLALHLGGRKRCALELLDGIDVLVTPTVGRAYTCDELKENPIELNNNIGYYTYPVSPLDLCALAVPASIRADGIPFGISMVAAAGNDGVLHALGRRFEQQAALKPGIDQKRR